ncbi:8818_t:CDS:2, partial [Acaulospora morrowiae]
DGRKFLSDEESKYPFPINDKPELIRSRMTHYLTKSVWKGNFSAPGMDERLKKGAKVLDVCCGLGFWTMDLANAYPNSTFVGIDLAPMFPNEDVRPPNAGFLECNILDGIPFPDDTFDFVYQRFVWSAFNEFQWRKIIQELVRVTKKGGVLELMEFDWGFKNPGPKTQ